MNNTDQKRGRIIGIVAAVLLLLPCLYIGVVFYADKLKYKKIEKYYHADTESFDAIVKYFNDLYKENLYWVKFDCNNTYLDLKLKYTNENGEINYTAEDLECTDASFIRELSKLREKLPGNPLSIIGIHGQWIGRLDDF